MLAILALKIVNQTIVNLFNGKIAPFLEQGVIVFGGIRGCWTHSSYGFQPAMCVALAGDPA
jgi:hypothetical protein